MAIARLRVKCKLCRRRQCREYMKYHLCDRCFREGAPFNLKLKPTFNESKTYKRNQSKRYISCELELASYQPGLLPFLAERNFIWVHDGTISGVEVHTPVCNGDLFLNTLKSLTNGFKNHCARIDGRCGYHLHLNAKDYNYEKIDKLLWAYNRLEKVFFSLVAKTRWRNRFCPPIEDRYIERHKDRIYSTTIDPITGEYKIVFKDGEDFPSIKEKINHFLVNNEKYHNSYYRDKHGGSRYSLNVYSWRHRGTIEIRMHQGTISYPIITRWALLWAKFLDKIPTLSIKTIKDLPCEKAALNSLVNLAWLRTK